MALTDIITKIRSEADAESARIISEAEAQAKKIQDEAKERAEKTLQAGKESAELLGKQTHERTMSAATYQAKFASQNFQRTLIDRVFDEVEERLKVLPESAHQKFVAHRAKTLPKEAGTLIVSKARREETLKALKDAGVDTKNVKEAEILGGFVFETSSIEYDHSLKSVAREAREQYAKDAAHLLFA